MATDIRLKEALPALTERIVETYEECGRIHHLGHSPLPSYREVVEILADLREILYPGYGRRQNLHMGNVGYHVGDLIDSLHDRLTVQIARAFRHDCKAARPGDRLRGRGPAHHRSGSSNRSPTSARSLADDVQAAFDGDPAAKNLDEILFCYPGLSAITVFRIAHELYKLGRPADPPDDDRVRPRQDRASTSTPARRSAAGSSSTTAPASSSARRREIGDGVKIYQGVTLGALSFPKDENGEHPPERQAAPDDRGRGRHLRQRDDPRRQDGHRPPLRHRLVGLGHPEHRRLTRP